MNPPLILSASAVVLSIFALGWQVYSWKRSGANLKIRLAGSIYRNQEFTVRINNAGRAPVSIVGLSYDIHWLARVRDEREKRIISRYKKFDPPLRVDQGEQVDVQFDAYWVGARSTAGGGHLMAILELTASLGSGKFVTSREKIQLQE